MLKNFYIWSSLYIIVLMTRVYARTREREKAWRLGGYAAGGSLIMGPIVTVVFRGLKGSTLSEMLWSFSVVLEAFCILPQLLLLRQTTVPTVIDSFYLLLLGSYRAFYIINWIVRAATEHEFDPIALIFGVIQTAFYADFAWVYWTRQRVKLRGGGVVDSDDLRKSFLVNRIISGGRSGAEADPEDADVKSHVHAPESRHWGSKGVSVSADDTLEEHTTQSKVALARGNFENHHDESQSMLHGDDIFSDADGHAPNLDDPENTTMNNNQKWHDNH